MLEAIIGATATIAVGVIAWVQWLVSTRASQRAEARQRDSEMTRWGSDVIDMMAELETACLPITAGSHYSDQEVERLSHHASALVDRGRLFFPNVPGGSEGPHDEGTRVKLLDEVLRACYVARHIAAGGVADRTKLREHVWRARRRFVTLLQVEMGPSLIEVGEDSRGAHVPPDPSTWPDANRKLNLPAQSEATAPGQRADT